MFKKNKKLLDDKVNDEIKNSLEFIPTRFHDDFMELINSSPQTVKSVQKNLDYFLEDILEELSDEEKVKMFRSIN